MDAPVHYALLCDDLHWEASPIGLSLAPDGSLTLVRVPAPAVGAEIENDPPFDAEPSGIAADEHGRIVLTVTDANRLLLEEPACGFRYALPPDATTGMAPAPFDAPAGVSLASDTLYVADQGHVRVQCFLLPSLELRRVIELGLARPTAVAADRMGRLYVLDRGTARILRFRADGSADASYNTAIVGSAASLKPAFFALAADEILYVSDETANAVCAFGPAGQKLATLDMPVRVPAVRPRALAVRDDHLFVADAASGDILVFDSTAKLCLGAIPGIRSAVAAMAFDRDGNLLIKPGGGEAYIVLEAAAGCIATGTLVAGPLDAGVGCDWERVAIEASMPPGSAVALATAVAAAASPPPTDAMWVASPSIDCLLAPHRGPAERPSGRRRFLWVKVTLSSADGRASPILAQVRAQTTGVSYLDLLPRIYARDDRDSRFLERWLALFRSGIEASEDAIDQMPGLFDPVMAPADRLPWLAGALAFDAPPTDPPAHLRELLARVPTLYAQRGTIAGLAAMAEIHTGIRPKIFEAYHARRVWQLGETSLLGFDTALAAATPEGFVVPRDARTDPRYAGLHGDYYKGVEFDELLLSRTDATIDFYQPPFLLRGGPALRALSLGDPGASRFSVRWTGQIKPRFSETYTVYFEHQYGARLWIDGRLLIDDWTGRPESVALNPRVVLDASRWHAIQIEVRSLAARTTVRLLWASRSEPKGPVPSECLYAVLDEHADLSAAPGAAFDVGHAVVGESRPQAASDFGAGLFADYAHLFTVVAPAGSCRDQSRRDALRALIDAEKPAYTDYHLCFAEPRMRVGFQARLGIDAIVAKGPPPLRLGETSLGRDSYLADAPAGGARLAARAKLGVNTTVG